MDFEDIGSLPISFNLQTDSLLEIVGLEGITVGNDLEQLVFPGTKRNRQQLQNPQSLSSVSDEVRSAKNIQISINGSLSFVGKCLAKNSLIERDEVSGISVDLFGGGLEFFQAIDGVKLPHLDLGSVEYNPVTIQNSWEGSYDSGWQGVFAPVIYQQLTNASGTNTFMWDHFRFHVYYPAIIKGIEEFAGVTIESNFFELPFFKKHTYLFGVGDAWKIAKNQNGYFEAFSNGTSAPVSWAAMSFADTPAPGSDPFGVWSGTAFTAPETNNYSFSGNISTGTNIEVRLITSTGIIEPILPGSAFNFSNINLPAGETARIEVQQANPAGVGFLSSTSSFTGRGESKPVLGGSIDVSSCLHENDIKEFLRGITHQFNLAWTYDSEEKTVYVEPRFDYEIDGVLHPGFYHHPINSDLGNHPLDWTGKLDAGEAISIELISPFGDSLTLKNKPEGSEAYERAQEQITNPNVEFLAVKMPLANTGAEGQTVENPYWEDLILVKNEIALEGMPIVCEEYDSADGLPEVGNFKSNPKYAYYAGKIPYQSWKHQGGTSLFNRPVLFQRPAKINTYDPLANAGFADWKAGPISYPGLVSIFYPTFYQTIFDGATIEAMAYLSNSEIQNYPKDFRRLRKIRIGQETCFAILLEINDFRPLVDQKTKVLLLRWSQPRAAVISKLIQSSQESSVELQI